MVCPNCGSNMSDKRKRCERCGTDLTMYKKVQRASNLFYNNGLAKARVRDLTGASVDLRKSLDLNKLNTNARNLLGLVYYEMGETVAALNEWVISKHFQPQNNDADEYMNKVQSNLTRLDALNQAIKRYNTALTFARQGSDDLAIIQLKKVITLNTNFLRAYQLLALLLIKTGDQTKALKYLRKAIKIDVSNTTTLRYLQELESIGQTVDLDSNPEAEQPGPLSSVKTLSSYKEDKPNIMAFVNLVIGVMIGLAVMAFLVLPTIKKNQNNEGKNDIIDSGYTLAQIQEKDNKIKELQDENTSLEEQVTDLQYQIDNIPEPEDKSLAYVSLLNAADLYFKELDKSSSQRDFKATADLLAGVEDTKIEIEAGVSLLTALRAEVYPDIARDYYNAGYALYKNAKYEEALVDYEKAMAFDPEDVDAVYFVARCHHRLGNKEKAAFYYNMVITEFPDSDRISEATDLLAQVQE